MDSLISAHFNQSEFQKVNRNISFIELDSQYEIPNFLKNSPKTLASTTSPQKKDSSNSSDLSSSPTYQSTINSISQLNDDLSLLKHIVSNIVSEINQKTKENQKKKLIINELKQKCEKNKKKISKMKKNIEKHDDKINELEKILNNSKSGQVPINRFSSVLEHSSSISPRPMSNSGKLVNLTLSTRSNKSKLNEKRLSLKIKVSK